jgi:hypothetical protein
MRLGEWICKLVFRRNKEQVKTTRLEIMSNEVTIDLNVFGAYMKDIIMSNIHDTLIATRNWNASGLRSTHVS